jgi:hypothetical protein
MVAKSRCYTCRTQCPQVGHTHATQAEAKLGQAVHRAHAAQAETESGQAGLHTCRASRPCHAVCSWAMRGFGPVTVDLFFYFPNIFKSLQI